MHCLVLYMFLRKFVEVSHWHFLFRNHPLTIPWKFLEIYRRLIYRNTSSYLLLLILFFFRKILHDQSTVLSKYHKLISDGFVQVCPFYLNCIHIFWSLIEYQELLGTLWLKANCPPSECFIWTLSKINRNSIMKKKKKETCKFYFCYK